MIQMILLIFFALASGVAVAGGTFAFIAAIGIVPRMAQRTETKHYIRLYEDVILFSGIWGCILMFSDIKLHVPAFVIGIYALFCGIFIGILAMALAEVLNVMPILMRRMKLQKGITWFVVSFALGKAFGSLLYFFVDGFYML